MNAAIFVLLILHIFIWIFAFMYGVCLISETADDEDNFWLGFAILLALACNIALVLGIL